MSVHCSLVKYVFIYFSGKSGDIFFLNWTYEDQIYFKDIALKFIESNSYILAVFKSEKEAKTSISKNQKYPIYFFKTDTSGEKHFEEFFSEKENIIWINSFLLVILKLKLKIFHSSMWVLILIKFLVKNTTKHEILQVIKKYIPEFNHIETGKKLDDKM